MSNSSKGKAYEREAMEVLKADGYMVEQAIPKTIWIGAGRIISVAHDFFGVWDIIAKKLGEPTLWVQVTTWESISPRRKKIQEYCWNSDFDCPVIYARIRGKDACFRLLYGRDGYEWTGEIKKLVKKVKINLINHNGK